MKLNLSWSCSKSGPSSSKYLVDHIKYEIASYFIPRVQFSGKNILMKDFLPTSCKGAILFAVVVEVLVVVLIGVVVVVMLDMVVVTSGLSVKFAYKIQRHNMTFPPMVVEQLFCLLNLNFT